MIVKYFQTIENELKSIGFNEGTLYYTTDTKRVYLDPVDERSRICVSSDPIILNTENDRTDLLAPIPGKIYFVLESSKIYVFYNGNWYNGSYKELPDYSNEDNDKVLKIIDGSLKWTEIESGSDILKAPKLIINALPGSTITCSNGSITKVGTENNGQWIFSDLTLNEEWTITAVWNSVVVTKRITFTEIKIEFIHIQYRMTPEFTYTGDYEIVDDTDSKIIDFATWTHDWKIRFLTSGELTFTNMYGFAGDIDLFLVGGGGGSVIDYGGGGGGYTKTTKFVKVVINTTYSIIIGAGGRYASSANNTGGNGGETSAFGYSAKGGRGAGGGGYGVGANKGGNGGSGGGCGGGGGNKAGVGGTDGKNGQGTHPGTGQGTTTREFEEPTGTLYAPGGGGGIYGSGSGGGAENTGGGGKKGAGYSGIAIIRNARKTETIDVAA